MLVKLCLVAMAAGSASALTTKSRPAVYHHRQTPPAPISRALTLRGGDAMGMINKFADAGTWLSIVPIMLSLTLMAAGDGFARDEWENVKVLKGQKASGEV